MRYSIKPIIRDDKPLKKNGKYPIYHLVRFNDIQIKIPSGYDIEKKYWNKERGKVKKGVVADGTEINNILNNKLSDFQSFIVKQELLKKSINREVVKSFFKGEQSSSCFYTFFDKQIELWKGRKKKGTLDNYRFTLIVLKQFRGSVRFTDLDLQFIEELDNYLRFTRGNSIGGAFGRHKCLKAIINASIKKGLMKETPYQYFRIKNPPKRLTFLNVEELKKLEQLNLPEEFTGQNKAKDFFLFSCYTGLRFSDLKALTYKNIRDGCLTFTMQKTNKDLSIPLIEKAKHIIAKYENHSERQGDLLLPLSNNKRTNINLKQIAEKCNINKPLTFHIARHTFASTHVYVGTHLILLKELMGHSSIEQTEIYAKPNTTQVQSCMLNLELL